MTSPQAGPTTPSASPAAPSQVVVSIVVPVHNAGQYLDACLDSLRRQTLQGIEILCYDDASTDDSAAILRRHASQDARLRLISYPENRSSSQARKDGALAATGEYLMFVDADDHLDPTACEQLARRMRQLDVDILQFGTHVLNAGDAEPERLRTLEALLAPLQQRLTGAEPFEACFLRGEYGHSLWNKIYRTSLAKAAFAQLPDGRFPKAQDLLAYYLLAWHASSYQGIPEGYYNYRFGAGITGAAEMPLDRLRIYATQVLVADAVEAFTLAEGGSASRLEAAHRVRRQLATDCVMQWYRRTPAESGAAGFDILAEAWPMADLTDALHRGLAKQQAEVATKLEGATAIHATRGPIAAGSTIGLYYHRLTIGGVQRVLGSLAQLYLDMGHQVVVLLDEEHPGREFALPEAVVRVQLPKPGEEVGYRVRAQALQQAMAEHGIDALVYLAAQSSLLLCDLLTVKALGVPFILSIHDSAFASMLTGSPGMATRPKVARLADAAQVLSAAEEAFWRSQRVPATFLPNPVTIGIADDVELAPEPGNLLWVGRLDTWVKQCLDLPRIMAVVKRSHPKARLHVVGDEWTPGIRARLEKQIRRLGVTENVILCGPTFDIERYYRRASVQVITSITECSPMAVVEARAFGIPIAMYRLPHLAMLQDGSGVVTAPQGDHEELGRAISSLLDDEARRQRLGSDGRTALAGFLEVDLAAAWRDLFARASEPGSSDSGRPVEIDVLGGLLSNALDIYLVSLRRRAEGTERLRRRIETLETALHKERSRPGAALGRRVRGIGKGLARRLRSVVSRAKAR